MTLEQIIQQYGYLAVFIGTCLEGEGVLLLAGYFAHRGYLSLPLVLLLAWVGAMLGDQVGFVFGRLKGRLILDRSPKWQPRAKWILVQVAIHERWLLLAFRFVPGVRFLTPIVLGMAGYPQRRFFVYNLIGAAAWSLIIGLIGYFAGHAASRLFTEVSEHEIEVILCLMALGFIGWSVRRFWLARRAKTVAEASNELADAQRETLTVIEAGRDSRGAS